MGLRKVKLYTIDKKVRCIKCGNRGAVKPYGVWYPQGLGDEVGNSEALAKYRNKEFMSHILGPGGTIPYECLNCGNKGLVDIDGLEGFRKAFERIR
jgi:hypothetical protein